MSSILFYFLFLSSYLYLYEFVYVFFFFYGYVDHRDLHVLTHSFPTRRSSDLEIGGRAQSMLPAGAAARLMRRPAARPGNGPASPPAIRAAPEIGRAHV